MKKRYSRGLYQRSHPFQLRIQSYLVPVALISLIHWIASSNLTGENLRETNPEQRAPSLKEDSTVANSVRKKDSSLTSPPVLIGASISGGLERFEMFKKLKLGNCVLTTLPMDKTEALAIARYCRQQRIRLYFGELLYRGTTNLCFSAHQKMPRSEFYSKPDLEEIMDEAGEYYGGRMTLGEAGGILYWPKAYLIDRSVGEYENLPPVETVTQAKDAYLRYLKRFLEYERNELGKGPLLNVDSGLVFKYHAEAGIDVLCHEMTPGDPHRMQAAIRGAARAFNKPWGTHIAIQCYGGMSFDPLWFKRWKNSLYYSYLTGAGFIWPEGGHLGYTSFQTGEKYSFYSTEVKTIRRILREIHQFSRIHTRPIEGPQATLGVVYGNCDGAPGLWNQYAWGQFHDKKWLAGPPERGWDLVDSFHRKEEWSNEAVQGEMDFSGNPPYGQYDIVPIEADAKVLNRYSCLVFLGWNTMTEEIYEKLKEYVRGGGHLVMYLAHLSTHTDRAHDLELFRKGDLHDLFGVKILGKGPTDVRGIKCLSNSSLPNYRFPLLPIETDPRFIGNFTPAKVTLAGAKIICSHDNRYEAKAEVLASQPVLVENTLGKGRAFLVTVWEYPADEGIIRFTRDLIRTVLAGEQGDIRLLTTDRVRYAVYRGLTPGSNEKYHLVYMLNTDPDCVANAQIWIKDRITSPLEVPSNEMRLAYRFGDVVVSPENRHVELSRWEQTAHGCELTFHSLVTQSFTVQNLASHAVDVRLNKRTVMAPPGTSQNIIVHQSIDPDRKEFYSTDFLEEPMVEFKLRPPRKS